MNAQSKHSLPKKKMNKWHGHVWKCDLFSLSLNIKHPPPLGSTRSHCGRSPVPLVFIMCPPHSGGRRRRRRRQCLLGQFARALIQSSVSLVGLFDACGSGAGASASGSLLSQVDRRDRQVSVTQRIMSNDNRCCQ